MWITSRALPLQSAPSCRAHPPPNTRVAKCLQLSRLLVSWVHPSLLYVPINLCLATRCQSLVILYPLPLVTACCFHCHLSDSTQRQPDLEPWGTWASVTRRFSTKICFFLNKKTECTNNNPGHYHLTQRDVLFSVPDSSSRSLPMSAPISPLTELPGCEHFSLQSVSLYLTSSNPPRNPVKEKLLVLVQKKRAPSSWPEFTRLKTVAQSPIPQLLALNVRFSSTHSSAELGSELFRFWVLSTRV